MTRESRGTDVVLHLRPEEDELLAGFKLREILREMLDHITVPIVMKKEQWDSTAKAQVITDEDEQINQASALWARSKSEISPEQYDEFYKHVGHDFESPLAHVHARVEGRQEYALALRAETGAIRSLEPRASPRHQALRPSRVHHGRCGAADAAVLRFVRGVIDSNDLPLNVSREILQQSRDVEAIRTTSVKRVLGLLEDLASKEADKFTTFWEEFGRVLKEGVVDDTANRDRIAKLLRFSSTHAETAEQTVSLSDRQPDERGQTAIYYITADGFAAKNSPHLEIFRKLGVEVLLMHDRIDEWVVSLTEFEGKPLQSIAKGGLDLSALGDEAVKKEQEQQTEGHRVSSSGCRRRWAIAPARCDPRTG